MSDRWYYTHAGQTLGPVTAAQLRKLASAGQLLATDLIWPEGRDRSQAAAAQAALDFGTLAAPLANKPDWLDDIRDAETTKPPPAAASPDWLDDIREAEEGEQAFLTLEWDADKLPPDEEEEIAQLGQLIARLPQGAGNLLSDEEAIAKELLDEGEEVEAEPMAVSPAASAPCRLVVGSATTRGRVRDRNEDSLLVQQYSWGNLDRRHDVALLVVADGMGGHAAGERASGIVIRTLSSVLTPLLTAALSKPPAKSAPPDFAEALDRGLHEANRIVREVAANTPTCKGMGSTAAVVLVWDGRAFISLVGDCRVHHWRGGRLTQVTRDQTLVARMVELGQLTPQEAATHPRRNEVAQAVGKYTLLSPVRYEVSLAPGDWLLVSSDGLQAHVEEPRLRESIAKAGSDAVGLANRLVDLANQGGGSDNCTVLAVHCV